MLALIAVTAKVGDSIEVQYYNMLAPILMYLPAAINPFIVFIFIRPYRRALQIFWRQWVNQFVKINEKIDQLMIYNLHL